jgi:hypothetical protein
MTACLRLMFELINHFWSFIIRSIWLYGENWARNLTPAPSLL